MDINQTENVIIESQTFQSSILLRDVEIDFYLPTHFSDYENISLLLINDGQDLVTMNFEEILDELYAANQINPILCVGIHCSDDRINEYGTAKYLDYKGRGTKAALYTNFIFNELLPFIHKTYNINSFKEKSFAGFSLGGLSALDIVWNAPQEFWSVGVFSGSLWWRDKDQDDKNYDEDKDKIMHRQIREGNFAPWLKFFFEVGTLDETADRNTNGIIDSIDDTVNLISDLVCKGYNKNTDIKYLELTNGKHDVPTWATALPEFLKWGWGYNSEVSD